MNRWSEITKEMTFEELDEIILRRTPKNQRELTKDTIKDIIEYINLTKPEFVIDIATGRGMLLNEVVKNIRNVVMILSLMFVTMDNKKLNKFYDRCSIGLGGILDRCQM